VLEYFIAKGFCYTWISYCNPVKETTNRMRISGRA
jgi:hypothetical protein